MSVLGQHSYEAHCISGRYRCCVIEWDEEDWVDEGTTYRTNSVAFDDRGPERDLVFELNIT